MNKNRDFCSSIYYPSKLTFSAVNKNICKSQKDFEIPVRIKWPTPCQLPMKTFQSSSQVVEIKLNDLLYTSNHG